MKVMLDLCSGLGGASEAFIQDGWVVIRIESNPDLAHVPGTRILDVLDWASWLPELLHELENRTSEAWCRNEDGVEVVWASPPCVEFSQAYAAPGPTAEREGREWKPDLDILEACRDIIDYVQPRHYVIENVMGAVRYFPTLLGPYAQHIGPFYLWGRFPHITMPRSFEHRKSEHDTWSDDPLRQNKLALVPFEISFQFLQVLKQQRSLHEWA